MFVIFNVLLAYFKLNSGSVNLLQSSNRQKMYVFYMFLFFRFKDLPALFLPHIYGLKKH